jgi:hypothetical protein
MLNTGRRFRGAYLPEYILKESLYEVSQELTYQTTSQKKDSTTFQRSLPTRLYLRRKPLRRFRGAYLPDYVSEDSLYDVSEELTYQTISQKKASTTFQRTLPTRLHLRRKLPRRFRGAYLPDYISEESLYDVSEELTYQTSQKKASTTFQRTLPTRLYIRRKPLRRFRGAYLSD